MTPPKKERSAKKAEQPQVPMNAVEQVFLRALAHLQAQVAVNAETLARIEKILTED